MATKKKTSALWNHFEEIEPRKKAKCLYCCRILAISPSSIGSLRKHMKSIHPAISHQLTMSEELVYSESEEEQTTMYIEHTSPPRTPSPSASSPPPAKRSAKFLYPDPLTGLNNKTKGRVSPAPTVNDDISTFGTFVAAQLRKFEPKLQSKAKFEISKILFNIEMAHHENAAT